jgi:hypothetical protein
MTTTTPPARTAAPARPTAPIPLWERHRLFQEPAYAEGLALEDAGDEDDEGGDE